MSFDYGGGGFNTGNLNNPFLNPSSSGSNNLIKGNTGSSGSGSILNILDIFSGSGGWGTLFNVVGAGASAFGAYKSYEQGKNLAKAFTSSSRKISQLQEQSNAEQRASNASQAAGERRQQLRESRIKRARIVQSSSNSGVSGSSGEIGGLGNLSTQLSSNIGSNLGSVQTASNITGLNQSIADTQSAYQQQANQPDIFGAIGNIGQNIFANTGGFNTLKSIFQ